MPRSFLRQSRWVRYTAGRSEAASLAEYPERGTPRDDLVPGLRTVPYRRRTIIGYRVVDGCVEVLRLVHGGQEWDGLEDGEAFGGAEAVTLTRLSP